MQNLIRTNYEINVKREHALCFVFKPAFGPFSSSLWYEDSFAPELWLRVYLHDGTPYGTPYRRLNRDYFVGLESFIKCGETTLERIKCCGLGGGYVSAYRMSEGTLIPVCAETKEDLELNSDTSQINKSLLLL